METSIWSLPGRQVWNLGYVVSHPFIPPVTRKDGSDIYCGSCAGTELYFKDYSVFKHPLFPYQDEYRMDVAVKCGECGLVQRYGIHITKEEYERITTDLAYLGRTTRRVTWMDVLKTLGKHILVNEGITKDIAKRVDEAIEDIEMRRRRTII